MTSKKCNMTSTSKIFTIQVTMTVIKDYTVRAKDECEAITLLQEACIVSTEFTPDVGVDKYYEEDFKVVRTSATIDVECATIDVE